MPTTSVGMAPVPKEAPPADVNILSPRFAVMWMIFFCNIVAGISIISFQSPIFQDLWRRRGSTAFASDRWPPMATGWLPSARCSTAWAACFGADSPTASAG